jgi:gluconolactonase
VNHGEVVSDGIYFPEGLAWSSEDQTLLVSSVQEGVLYRVWPGDHRKVALADLAGGANNVAVANGGGALVAQNGGLDAFPATAHSFKDIGPWPEIRSAVPGLVHVASDGSAQYVVSDSVESPNDVVVASDNTVYFTDPGNPFLDRPREPCIRALSPRGDLTTVASGFEYCNGIELESDEVLLITDHSSVSRVTVEGEVRPNVYEASSFLDGLCVDVEGRIYVAASRQSGVIVLENDKQVDFLKVSDDGSTSNCCFGGPENRWLFATDTRRGHVIVLTDMPTPGRTIRSWDPFNA